MITINKIDATTFEVTVSNQNRTQHRVTVEPAYYERLTDGQISAEMLVQRSFEFLLQREPNTAILEQFDLSLISQYFPEYEDTIRQSL